MPLNAKLVAAGILVTLFFSSVMFYAGQRLRQQREEDDPPSPDTSSSSSSSSTPSTSRHLEDRLMRINSEYLELFRNAVMNRLYNDYKAYRDGRNIPPHANAMTMAGTRRVDHFANVVAAAIADDVPGDIIETGVWRGGAAFLAAKVVDLLYEGGSSSDDRPAANNKKGTDAAAAAAEEKSSSGRRRVVYLSDSFRGIPPMPEAKHASDREAWEWDVLNNNSLDRVQKDSAMLGLKPSVVRWVPGYFNESLPALVRSKPTLHFAVVRLDGDTYDSTMQALDVLYPRLSVGGYLIVDDYSDWVSCREAVDTYRTAHNVTSPLVLIPHDKGEQARGVYWVKPGPKKAISSSGSGGSSSGGGKKGRVCVGDGLDATGRMVSLRVKGSYSPNTLAKMPPDGPDEVNVLQLTGRKDLMMCKTP